MVSEIVIHPEYRNSTVGTDIALLKLSSPVSFNTYIRPICLAGKESLFHHDTQCWTTGWGRTEKDGEYSLYRLAIFMYSRLFVLALCQLGF